MSPEQELELISKMPEKELRQRLAIAWRNLRRNNPEVARLLWKRRKAA